MRFTISSAFAAAVAQKPTAVTKRELAIGAGIAPVEFSRFLRGSSFGRITRLRIIAVGQRLGLSADDCTVPYNDPIFRGGE